MSKNPKSPTLEQRVTALEAEVERTREFRLVLGEINDAEMRMHAAKTKSMVLVAKYNLDVENAKRGVR
jgi:hypothetical protein